MFFGFLVRCGMDLAFTGRCCGFSNYFIVFSFLLLFVFAVWSASPCDCSIADAFPNQKQQTKPAAKPAAGTAPRFEIKKWNAVAMWSWDICADTVSFLGGWLFPGRSPPLSDFCSYHNSAPFAATLSTSRPSSTRPIPRPPTTMVSPLPLATAATSFTLIASSVGSRPDQFALFVIKNGIL
jgi:hypothetical protein